MTQKEMMIVTLTLALLTFLTVTGCAKGRYHHRGRRQGPPTEAVEACEGKQSGDIVEFIGRRGEEIQARCREINGRLVAVPDDVPHGGGQTK